ncbi:hypothetical protein [Peribacillus sp. ACCC06369]|nr:hypothetical protein [Peribacillus sp. ACCC06369]
MERQLGPDRQNVAIFGRDIAFRKGMFMKKVTGETFAQKIPKA